MTPSCDVKFQVVFPILSPLSTFVMSVEGMVEVTIAEDKASTSKMIVMR